MKIKYLLKLLKGKDKEKTIWIPNWDYGEYQTLDNLTEKGKFIKFKKKQPQW